MSQSRRTAKDKSSAVVGSVTAVALVAQNYDRKYLLIQNISAVNMWLSFVGAAAAATEGSFILLPNSSFTFEGECVLQNAVSIIAASGSGNKVTAYEA